ncbi:MAG: hypothetical protein ACI351_07065 [Candidatus Avelusimicrobium sp.]|uniref:hypothetical protein n=1 Tax=Candidatus Avelusimicrobium sp. TaxID=3048833 RepID=UPI003F037A43
MKKIVTILCISLFASACVSVNSAGSASKETNQVPDKVENPYCEDEFKSYKVFQVLPDFVLVRACKDTTCKTADDKVLLLFKEIDYSYTEGEIINTPDVFCRTYIKDYAYQDKSGKQQFASAFMLLPKNMEKSFLQQIKSLRGEPLDSTHLLTIAANPKAGFEWDYLIYLPEDLDISRKLPILFMMTNTGHLTSSKEELQQDVLEYLNSEKQLADKLGVPLLIPIVSREENLYSHELSRAVFVLQEGPLKHLDFQIVNMFKDARRQLKKKGIHTQKKMFVAGASAAGAFAWRWTLLHPEYVLATVAAIQHYPTLPLNELNGEELIFPIGVSDVKQYTGKPFNKKAWQKVPIFVYEGGSDYNDTLLYDECYPGEQRELIHKLYDENGEDDEQVRVRSVQKVLSQVAPNVQTHVYPNMGHLTMPQDTALFLQQNQNGGSVKRITPTDTSSQPAPLPLRVSDLYWGTQAPLIHDKKYLKLTDLTMKIQKSYMTHTVWQQKRCSVDVLQGDREILYDKRCNGVFWGNNFDLLHITFSSEEVAKLKATGKSTFRLRSHASKIVDIPGELTFTIH